MTSHFVPYIPIQYAPDRTLSIDMVPKKSAAGKAKATKTKSSAKEPKFSKAKSGRKIKIAKAVDDLIDSERTTAEKTRPVKAGDPRELRPAAKRRDGRPSTRPFLSADPKDPRYIHENPKPPPKPIKEAFATFSATIDHTSRAPTPIVILTAAIDQAQFEAMELDLQEGRFWADLHVTLPGGARVRKLGGLWVGG